MNMNMSEPFLSADRRTLYVIMSNGERRRVMTIDGDVVFVKRQRKAEKKASKRAVTRMRRASR